ncbi:hypothetical protein MXD62_10695, partial [Frankia sp. Mgl5]|uniref:hypothetical protein n=1 Tax=Frankia sp. Mgl5 TaxID=2933793 RepID=UPI00200FCA54
IAPISEKGVYHFIYRIWLRPILPTSWRRFRNQPTKQPLQAKELAQAGSIDRKLFGRRMPGLA